LNTIVLRIIALIAPVLSAMVIGSGSARADSGGKVETSYEVNVGGLTVLDIKYSSEVMAAGYRSQASIETRGMANFFSDYRMKMAASGALAGSQSSPLQYRSRSEKKDKEKTFDLNWSQGVLLAADRQAEKNPQIQAEIDSALTPDVTDPLTAIFRIGTLPGGNPCRAAHRIFDGKEVFELRFSFKREAVLDASFPGAYHGKAYECRATYVPVAGRYAAKFRKRNEEPPTYNVWLAPIGADASGGLRLVPVRATGRLDELKFEAYVSRVKIDGRAFKKISATGN
jgi:hypothetical protein